MTPTRPVWLTEAIVLDAHRSQRRHFRDEFGNCAGCGFLYQRREAHPCLAWCIADAILTAAAEHSGDATEGDRTIDSAGNRVGGFDRLPSDHRCDYLCDSRCDHF